MARERVMLAKSDGESDDDDDLYQGYNEFHPVLDTRNLLQDDEFKETVNKSSYGRSSRQRTMQSTTGLAFNRSTALKSRQNFSRGTAAPSVTTSDGGNSNRPLTAVRGAGYTSHGNQNHFFDPLGLAQSGNMIGNKTFHLQDENAPEWKIKQLELQINRLLEESVHTACRQDYGTALDLAKDCVAKERSLNRLKEQSGLMETYGSNSDLTFSAMFNLAEQYSNSKMWTEAIDTYQSILKNRSFTNTGRLRMNIGEIYFRQGQYPRAIKFFRMALDQIPNTQNELRLQLMQNIGLSFVKLNQFADAIASFEYIVSERGDWDAMTVFHLIVCYYALGDNEKMKYYFNKLLQVKIEDQFEERYGHHDVLTDGGNLASSILPTDSIYDRKIVFATNDQNISSPGMLIRDERDHYNSLLIEAIRNDRLRMFEKEKIHRLEWYMLTAAKLISPFIENTNNEPSVIEKINTITEDFDLNTSANGYDWCLDQIRRMASMSSGFSSTNSLNFSHLADELELHKALCHLRSREFDQAIITLKNFEKKDKLLSARAHNNERNQGSSSTVKTNSSLAPSTLSSLNNSNRSSTTSSRVFSAAATNLSFLYSLQQDYDLSMKYANEAIAINRYCLGAILNKGNIHFYQGDYQQAADLYSEIIANNSTIFEAYFNLSLAERYLGNFEKALDALYRLRTVIKVSVGQNIPNVYSRKINNSIEVNLLYQIGIIYESMKDTDQAIDFYQKVLNIVPTDISLLVKMADLAAETNDRKQSLNYLLEAYRYLPSHIPTIERLAAYYIEMKMYDQTIKYLEQLSKIQPNLIKWQLMIAACYRRAGNYQQALIVYQDIHRRFPDNIDCLKFLIRICADLEAEGQSTNQGRSYVQLSEQYSATMRRLEKTKELREHQQQTSSRSTSRTSTAGNTRSQLRTSASSREGESVNSGSSSAGSGSSGYMTSGTPAFKSNSKLNENFHLVENGEIGSSISKKSNISAIVDEVVEKLDSTVNERPLTSWRNRLKSSHGRSNNNLASNAQDYEEDLLIDANIDEMLPD